MTEKRPYITSDFSRLSQFVMGLYKEDGSEEKMNLEKLRNSLKFFEEHPDLGEFIMITLNSELIGYCLLTNYYSNEYGGRMVIIDEFYIDTDYRSKGLGSDFLIKMMKENKRKAVAYQLEVFYGNENALKLYKRLGFKEHERHHLIKEFN